MAGILFTEDLTEAVAYGFLDSLAGGPRVLHNPDAEPPLMIVQGVYLTFGQAGGILSRLHKRRWIYFKQDGDGKRLAITAAGRRALKGKRWRDRRRRQKGK